MVDLSSTYTSSGVDINQANAAKKQFAEHIQNDKRILSKPNSFAAVLDLNLSNYKDPVIVCKTEEPGSKQVLALQHDRVESICYDMINHLINDCIVMGATPLFVQDAIICGKIEEDKVVRMVKAISTACKANGCKLTGGETSEQPGVIPAGTYILSSSIIGIVERDKIVDGSSIKEGDIVLGLESTGLHTNGYSLVRALLNKNPELANKDIYGRTFLDKILLPHRCYYNSLKTLFPHIHGMAHITGGGIQENLNRILPDNLDADINLETYRIPPVFKVIKEEANISDEEMLRVFNLGIGMAIVVNLYQLQLIADRIKSFGFDCYVIGQIVPGTGKVNLKNALSW